MNHSPTSSETRSPRGRPGFTMLELLITTAIMLILMAITVTAIRVNSDADRVRGGARQVQSYLLGARDRAIYANAPRGVRFLVDPTNPRTVSSMIYVEPTPPWLGQIEVRLRDPSLVASSTNQMVRLRQRLMNAATASADVRNWSLLIGRGQLVSGMRIRIPASNRGNWYVIQGIDTTTTPGVPELYLTTEYRTPTPSGQVYEQAEIELPPTAMPNIEPVKLPRGVVIDLDRCGVRVPSGAASPSRPWVYSSFKLPGAWVDGNVNQIVAPFFTYTNRMDLMFSPRGVITGPPAAAGILHFYLTEQSAADLELDPAYGTNDPNITDAPEKNAVTVFTRTGTVIASPILTTDATNNGYADDPFKFAESGEIAGR